MTEDMPESTSLAEWVEQLHSPETRRTARQRLVAARAVNALIDSLGSYNESVVWAAVVSLGELRAAEAVEPLVGLLERGVLEVAVVDSLRQITGKDLGRDPRRWRASLGAAASQPAFDVGRCMARTAEYLGVPASRSGSSYVFRLPLTDGRSQRVAVSFDRHDAQDRELVVLYSECGPANPKVYEAALRRNLSMPFGAFAIRDLDGRPNLVVVETVSADAVTPDSLAAKIEQIATQADEVERQLTKQDRR